MTHWLYSFLIRLHPTCFRERFGEQMLSIFDDSVRQRGGIHLLADAALSLLRQRLFRSDPAVARCMNLIWILSVIPVEILVALQVNPTTKTVAASLAYALLPIFIFLSFYPLLSRGFSGDEDRLMSISGANRQQQTKLERQRDIFRGWAEYTGTILFLCLYIWGVPLLIGALAGGARVTQSWAFVNSVVVAVQTLTYFAVLKRVNKEAADALQQKINAGRF
jgi:hypothetical protein